MCRFTEQPKETKFLGGLCQRIIKNIAVITRKSRHLQPCHALPCQIRGAKQDALNVRGTLRCI